MYSSNRRRKASWIVLRDFCREAQMRHRALQDFHTPRKARCRLSLLWAELQSAGLCGSPSPFPSIRRSSPGE